MTQDFQQIDAIVKQAHDVLMQAANSKRTHRCAERIP